MKKILSNSRTTEVQTCAVRMSKAYSETAPSSDTHLVGIFTQIDDGAARLQTAINRSKTESELEEKDEIRDLQYRSLFYLVNGLLHHPDPAIAAAAKKVYAVLEKYGLSASEESYSVESALVSSLLEDLSAEGLQASIEALTGCAELIAALQTAQDGFMTVQKKWDQERAKEGKQESATTIKKELLKSINKVLIVYLEAMITVNAASYGAFADVIDRIIADNNEAVRVRREKEDENNDDEEKIRTM